MGYLFLALALAAGGIKGYCGKKMSSAITSSSDSVIMNALRMALCVVIGFLLILVQGNIQSLSADGTFLWIALLSSVSSAIFVVSWLLSVKSGAYMMVEVFLLLGVIVPIVLCRIFFNEEFSLRQLLGIFLLLAAVYVMCTYNKSIKGKIKPLELILLILCGVSNGLTDFSQKLFVKMKHHAAVAAFNFYSYLFAGVLLLFAYFVFRKFESKKNSAPPLSASAVKSVWFFILIMAICLFAHSFFKTQSAAYLDAVQLYPLSQGISVLISLFLSSVFFKEKINIRCIVGIVGAFAALMIINL